MFTELYATLVYAVAMYPLLALMTMKRGAYPLHLVWNAEAVYPSLDALNNKVDVEGDKDSAAVCKVDVVKIVDVEYGITTGGGERGIW